MKKCRRVSLAAAVALGAAAATLQAQAGARVENWDVPDRPAKALDLSPPVSFVAMAPCRIVDTRGPAGPYGGPALPAATTRVFDLDAGPCTGLPSPVAVEAYSLNITVTQTQGFGDLRAWPTGLPPPLVSTLNYVPNQTVANAAIVPANEQGSISIVAAVSGTDLIIDINGYFTSHPNAGNRWDLRVVEAGGPVLYVRNLELAAPFSYGIHAETRSGGARSFGVFGRNNILGETGGVLGIGSDVAVPNYGAAGVRGEDLASFGVLGISQGGFGVAGSNVTGGAEQTWAGLACDDTQAVCGMGTLNITGSKSFVEPHPTDARKVIKFVSLEGNEAGTYFRGRGKFERGLARISVPDEFRMVTEPDELSVQVTPIGEMASVAVVRIDLDEIIVKSSRNVEFFYLVHGMRKGYGDFAPIVEEEFFVPRSAEYRMPEGLSLEAKRKLIANGTYNEDGSVNIETAKRLGWTAKWKGEAPAQKE